MNNPRVMFDSQEPIERSDDSGAALPSTTCTFPATEKTKEKRCFISHSSEDAEWIKEMITKLEKENDIRCIYAERDFYPGKPILDNIVTSIRNSTIIIVALSPAFLDSRFCEYETQMALMEHLTTAPKQIVSIRLKECVIPDFISHLTYLDVEDSNFWEKFLLILKTGTTGGVGSQFASTLNKYNGKNVWCIPFSAYAWSGFDYEGLHKTLSSKGIRVPKNVTTNALDHVWHNVQFVFMNWFSKILLLANYFNSALLIIPLILIVLCYKLFNDVIIAMIYYAILGILLISILSGIFLNWATNSFKELSYTVNERLIDHGLITAFHWNEVDINYRLDFIYFKSNMCLEYLKMYLDERCEKEKKENEKRPLLSISQRFRREPKDEIKNTSDIAKKELIKISSLYVHKLMNRTLLHPVTGHRHATTGMCLCQLVQAEVYEETI